MNPYRVENFGGGIADGFLAVDGDRHANFVNFYLDENKKPVVRDGLDWLDNRIPPSSSDTRPSGIYLGYDPFGYPLVCRGAKLFRIDATETPVEILGPTSNTAFPNKTQDELESVTLWQRQIIAATAPDTSMPARILNTATNTFVAYTLGLPAFAANPTVSSSGGTGSTYLWGFHWLWVFQDELGTAYQELGPPVYVQLTNIGAPNANSVSISALPSITNTASTNYDTTSFTAATIGTTNGSKVLTGFATTAAILPEMALTGSGIPAGSKVVSKTSTTVTIDKAATATASVTVTLHPLVLKIFRTAAGGVTQYDLATIANGTTTYTDSIADASINTNPVIYTDGDVQPWEAPSEEAKYVVEVNDFFWYAGDRFLQQSNQGAPGGCPSLFSQPISQKVKGLGATDTFPILFCDSAVYRIEGTYDEFGDGGFETKDIDANAGCISNRSIVNTPKGIFWAGNGGFYVTDGYSATCVSRGIPIRYKAWATPMMQGCYNPAENTVEWTTAVVPNQTTQSCEQKVVLHLNFGISEYMPFTVHSSPGNLYPSALAYSASSDVPAQYRNRILMTDARGYLLWQDTLKYTDPTIDITASPTAWKKKVIRYRYESPGYALGESLRAYSPFLTMEVESATEVSCRFYSRRDSGGAWEGLSELRRDGVITWGISDYDWNDPDTDILWNSAQMLQGQRHFKESTLRASRRQIALTNSKTWIAKSDTLGTASYGVAGPYKTLTLDDVTQHWPYDCEDYEITFPDDRYAQGYVVFERTSDTVITVIDPYGTMPNQPTMGWQMRGYRKDERLKLLSFTIWTSDAEQTQTPSRGPAGVTNA